MLKLKIPTMLAICISIICCCGCASSAKNIENTDNVTVKKVASMSNVNNTREDKQAALDLYEVYRGGAKYLNEYKDIANIKSLILIEQKQNLSSHATLTLVQKYEGNKWQEVLRCNAFLGLKGINKIKEGDKKTPTGDFGITTAFGIKDKPDTALEYLKVNSSMYCCGDKEFYNQIIDLSKVKHVCSRNSEHLIKYQPQYNYALFLDYNSEREFGKGSAIFLHCTGNYDYTLGCISISEADMLKVMKFIDSKVRICIYPYTNDEAQK